MAYYYVYVPFSGAVGWARACYNNTCANGGGPCMNNPANTCTACGGQEACGNNLPCPHCNGINGLCCPGDIGGPANVAVRCYISSNIKSIRTIKTGPMTGQGYDPQNDGDGLCGTAPPLPGFAWVNEGVKVELYCAYGAQGSLIGRVFYGHLRNRVANGVYDNPNGKILGYLGDRDCCTCAEPCANPVPWNCRCACYRGIHIHMERNGSGTTYAWQYNQALTTSNWVYQWTGPNVCAQ